MDPFSKKMFFPENVMNIIYRAIEVYKEDKKTKDEIESYYDNQIIGNLWFHLFYIFDFNYFRITISVFKTKTNY